MKFNKVFVFFLLPTLTGCMFGLDKHITYDADYIVMAHSIDVTKNKKKGEACSTTRESNQDLVFAAARNGNINKEIIFIEKVSKGGQYCTIVYGE